MNLNDDTLKQIVEAAIMASEAPLGVRQILALFPEDACPAREQVADVIEQLSAECEGRGIELRKIGNGYRFQTREGLAPWLRKLNEGRPPRYSRALLETIAIVAYRQPVTRGDIEDIRGVAVSTEIMRTLQERDWIKQVGVRDAPGHPALYGTTPAFLAYFNLESLKELPALIEQRDLELIAREQNIQLPVPETEGEDAQSGEQGDTLVEGDVDDNGIDSPDEPATGPESAEPTAESETADESPRGDSGSRPAADDSGGAGTSRGE